MFAGGFDAAVAAPPPEPVALTGWWREPIKHCANVYGCTIEEAEVMVDAWRVQHGMPAKPDPTKTLKRELLEAITAQDLKGVQGG